MKSIFQSLCSILFLCLLSACSNDDDNDPTEAQTQINKLIGKEWRIIKVTRDGIDLSSNFTDFTLTFSGKVEEGGENVKNGSFRSENGLTVFSNTGKWHFQPGQISSQIILANRNTDYILSNKDNHLKLAFFYSGEINTRQLGISGEYVFELEAD